MAPRIWTIAMRELREGLRNKTFLVAAVLTPGLLVAALFVPPRIDTLLKRDQVSLAVAAADAGTFAALERSVREHNARPKARPRCLLERAEGRTPEEALDSVRKRLESGELAALLFLDPALVKGEGEASLFVHPAGLSAAPREVNRWVGEAVRRRRLEQAGIRGEQAAALEAPLRLETRILGERDGEATLDRTIVTRLLVPVAGAVLLFLGIFAVSQLCLTNLIEERSGRVLEVLLASVTPLELMSGKILGNGLLGLAVCSFWGTIAAGAARSQGLVEHVSAGHLILLGAYFVLGFLLFAGLHCAAGSFCETVQGAQALMMPLTFAAAFPLMLSGAIVQNPSAPLAQALSLIPPMTPFVMMFRLAVPPGPNALEIVGSLLALALGVAATTWCAAKIFRVGILMHGRAPAAAEIWRWIRG